jgi:hypothetical protein
MSNPLRGTGPVQRNSQRRVRSSSGRRPAGSPHSQSDGCPLSVIVLILRVVAVIALAALIRERTRR